MIYIIRTNGRPWADRPRPILAATSLGALLVALALPFTPVAHWLGFQTPPLAMTAGIMGVAAVYLICAELLKRAAIKPGHHRRQRRQPALRAESENAP